MAVILLLTSVLGLLMLVPLRLQADLLHDRETLGRFQLSAAGLSRQWRMKLTSTPCGHQLIFSGSSGQMEVLSPKQLDSPSSRYLRNLLRQSPRARHYLLQHIHLVQLDASLRIHLQSAAHTALLTGLLRSSHLLLPVRLRQNLRLLVIPDFHQGQTRLQARCILRIRTGTIVLTGLLLLCSAIRREAMKAREAA